MLLYGPPGTGKTTLCKALCQKIAIRLTERYADVISEPPDASRRKKQGHFIEINAHRYTTERFNLLISHSLFSKWFSESGKLVMRMFDHIRERVDDEDSFVFVMIGMAS